MTNEKKSGVAGGFSAEDLDILQQMLDAEDGASGTDTAPIPTRQDRASAPLSFAQQRLWLLQQLDPDSPVYNVPVALQIGGRLDLSALRQAFAQMMRRHDILRVSFVKASDGPRQLISDELDAAIELKDITRARDPEKKVRQLIDETVREPFDLSAPPLLRARLLRLEAERHVFVFVMHHIICDGWSMGVFIRELTQLYQDFANGLHPKRAAPNLQYADFAAWQRTWLDGNNVRSQIDYWKKQLRGDLPAVELPTDRQRPAIQTSRGALEKHEFSDTLLRDLKRLSRANGATLFMTLVAGFDALLYRYTGQEDCLLGTVVANRNRSELESMLGFFVNTLVLRTDLSGNPRFRELLGRVRETTVGAFDHQDLPFEKLVEEIKPDRDVSRTPLFQIMFAFQNAPKTVWNIPGLELRELQAHTGRSKFDLTISTEETTTGLETTVEFNVDLFSPDSIRRLLANFETILASAAAGPDLRLSELALLTEADRRQLAAWRGERCPWPAQTPIHELVERQAADQPEKVAAVCGDARMTYGQLNARSNQLARVLRKHDTGPETLVAICCERNLAMLVGMLACLKAGAAFLPLDPSYPRERLRYMLHDSEARILLTQEHLLAGLPAGTGVILCVDRERERIDAEDSTNLNLGVELESPAYVIYTSGSAGLPKGVVLRHGGLLNLAHWHISAFEVAATDRASQLAATAFDASVWEIWPYLAAGASVHLTPGDVLTSPETLRDWFVEKKISLAFVPTPLAEPLLTLDWPESTALRTLLVGGDKLHDFPRGGLPFRLVNNYGPTENTVVATSGDVCEDDRRQSAPSIGRAIPNTEIFVLDGRQNTVPVGVAGELCLGGDSLARGYLRRPALTAEKFIPHPFSATPGARIYRTGDRVRFLADGSLEFLGRMDNQVKIRGFRIELGEIEATLEKAPGVATAIAAVRTEGGDPRLVAYIVPEGKKLLSIEVVRHELAQRLPTYMIPSAFVFLEELPLTANGKVDRAALPAPDGLRPDLGADFVPPETELERSIASVWQEALGINRVGIHDNFFDLGGHSLLLVSVQTRLREVLNREISMVDLFKYTTVDALRRYFSENGQGDKKFDNIHDTANKQKQAIRRQTRLMKEVKKYE